MKSVNDDATRIAQLIADGKYREALLDWKETIVNLKVYECAALKDAIVKKEAELRNDQSRKQ